jgi:hypothetical protein
MPGRGIRRDRCRRRDVAAAALGGLLVGTLPLVWSAAPAAAAPVTVTVTSTADDGSAGTLRWAVAQANLAPSTDAVTIVVPAGTYALSACAAAPDDTNAAGDLDATPEAALTLTGLGAGATIQQTCAGERVLDVLAAPSAPSSPAAAITLINLTVSGGDAVGDGGGIRSAGDVTLQDTTLDGNHAAVPSPFLDPVAGVDVHGGGVASTGVVTVTGGRVQNNSVAGGDAGYSGTSTGLPSGDGLGGGIWAPTVLLDGVTVTANHATGGLGAPDIYAMGYRNGGAGRGGGVAGDHVTIIDATLTLNGATGGDTKGDGEGGAAWANLLDVTGSTLQSNRADGATGALQVCGIGGGVGRGGALAGGTVHVESSVLASNSVLGGYGGGGDIQACSSGPGGDGEGGAIHATALTVSGSDLSANSAAGGPGGSDFGCPCTTGDSGGLGRGGALHASASVVVSSSTLGGDLVAGGRNGWSSGGPGASDAFGNEVYSGGTATLSASTVVRPNGNVVGRSTVQSVDALVVDDSTISDVVTLLQSGTSISAENTTLFTDVPSTTAADAPRVAGAPTISLTHVTAVDVSGGSGTMPSIVAGTLDARASLLASQTGLFPCNGMSAGSLPTTTSHGGNVARDPAATCGFTSATDLSADDPTIADLVALGDHGGPTPTIPPRRTNPAVDRDPSPCALPVDQRGEPRPVGAGCDAGAVELAAPVASISGTVTDTGTATPLSGITVTLMTAHPAWILVATTTTDAVGHYQFVDLADGDYAVRFFDGTGVHERRWWSSAPTYKGATPITVTAGASAPADQALSAAPPGAVHGRAQTKAAVGLAGIDVKLFDATAGYVGGTRTGPGGYYQFKGVPAGSYYVQFVDPTHTYLSRWCGDVLRFSDATPVIVAGGATWSSVILR